MAYTIATVSQKGGVGKSTLTRLIAVEAAKGGLLVKIADLDTQQGTCVAWAVRRVRGGLTPVIRAEPFDDVGIAVEDAKNYDLFLFDGAPHSSHATLRACLAADLVVVPTGEGLDDLGPSVILANNLLQRGVAPNRIAFALCITSDSTREIAGAREYLGQTRYRVLDGEIPFRASYKAAMDQGKALTETPFPTLRRRADKLAQAIVDAVADVSNGR